MFRLNETEFRPCIFGVYTVLFSYLIPTSSEDMTEPGIVLAKPFFCLLAFCMSKLLSPSPRITIAFFYSAWLRLATLISPLLS